jgi:O-antigen ligase
MTAALNAVRPVLTPTLSTIRHPSGLAAALQGACALVVLILLSEAPMGLLLKVGGEGMGPVVVLGWLAAYGAATFGLLLGTRQTAFLSSPAMLLAALAVLAFASISWSIAPGETKTQSVSLAGTLICAAFLAFCFEPARLVRLVARVVLGLAVLTILLALAVPSVGQMQEAYPGAWSGPWLEKNRTGAVMAMGMLACLAASVGARRAWAWWLGAALCLVMILLAESATSLAAALVGTAAMMFVLACRRGPAFAALTVYGALVGMAGVAALLAFAPDLLLGLLGREMDLTGRADIWQAVERRIADRPLTGHGYGGFWHGDQHAPIGWIWRDIGFEAKAAHNGWLDAQLELGAVGLVLVTGFMAAALVSALRVIVRDRVALWALPVWCAVMVFATSESVLMQANNFVALCLYVGALATAAALRRTGRDQGASNTAAMP